MATTSYYIDAEKALGRGLKLALYNYQFPKVTTGKTGGITLTFTSFSTIVHAFVGGVVTDGYVAEVNSISDNTVGLKIYQQGAATGALTPASTTGLENKVVRIGILGY